MLPDQVCLLAARKPAGRGCEEEIRCQGLGPEKMIAPETTAVGSAELLLGDLMLSESFHLLKEIYLFVFSVFWCFNCMAVCHLHAVPSETGRGSQIHWDWS